MWSIWDNIKKNIVDHENILFMNEMINHRGPDQSGYLKYKNLLLGHVRLSVLDISDKGRHPMSVNGQHWIIFNGEVYNYKEIKKDLIKKNYKFYSKTDTEVVLNAFIEWGTECFSKFNGDWVIAIFNKKTEEQKSRYMSRQKQVDLAKVRNQKHIGPKEEIFN